MKSSGRLAYALALVAILAGGGLLRCAGLTENSRLHPDEPLIALWMDRMYETHSLSPDSYAGGFFVLADAGRKTAEWLASHPLHRWSYFVRGTDRFAPPRLDAFSFGRPFNVFLGMLAIWIVAAWTRRITGSRAGAVAAAALMAGAAFPVEHAHYLESDVTMLATVSLALGLMARFLATRRISAWMLAAFASGFAAGTKFPMTLLLIPLLACVRPARAGAGRRPAAARIALLMLLGAVFALAGFVVASPDALDFAHFREGLQKSGAAVYAETEGILGLAAGQPRAREWMNAANMFRFAKTLGAGWLTIAALGLPLCFARRFRSFWPVSLLFPALYLGYIVFLAPWSRSQEFMALLPSFCLWAALPIAFLWSAPGTPLNKVLALGLGAAAFLPAMHDGIAVSSQFAWEDTRRLAQRTLAACFPAERPLGNEIYVAPADALISERIVGLYKFEIASPAYLAFHSLDYALLNPDIHGRGIFDHRTGKRFPPYAERMDDLRLRGRRLAAWAALDSSAPQPTFRAPRIELWLTPPREHPEPFEDVGVGLPRPALVQDFGRTTFFKGDLRAGPRFAVPVDRSEREIAIGGPGRLEGPVFLVFSAPAREVAVRAKGFGQTRRLDLGANDADVLPLERPRWTPRWSRYERVRVRAETGGYAPTNPPCFLRVAFDPVEAATILLDDGHPDQALALLRRYDALEKAGPFWQSLAGEPAAVTDARALLAAWERGLARDEQCPPAALSDGIPLAVWQDFARIRCGELGSSAAILPTSPDLVASPGGLPLARLLSVPDLNVCFSISLSPAVPRLETSNSSTRIFLDANAGAFRFEFQDPGHAPRRNRLDLPASGFPRDASWSLRTDSATPVRAENAEFTWSWRDLLAIRANQLRRALAELPPPPDSPPAGNRGLN